MKGVYFNLDLTKIQKAKNLGLIQYKNDWPIPEIEYPNQVRIKTLMGGICGTDLHQLFLELSPFAGILGAPVNPSPLGHEIVGLVDECGPQVEGLKKGDRVILNPLSHCVTKNLDLCPSCREGDWQQCYNITGGGFVTGVFSEYFVAYKKQLYKVHSNIPNDVAVLTEPFAVAIHAVCRNLPKDDNSVVVVVGAGTIGLMIIAAIRKLGNKCKIISLARYPFQAEIAKKLGADEIITDSKKAKLYKKMAEQKEGSKLFSVVGNRYIFGNAGPDMIYDSIGTEQSMTDCLHYIKSNGKIVVVGLGYATTKNVDWAIQAWKEVDIVGSMMYGLQTIDDKLTDPFEMALEFLSKDPDLFKGIVTHKFQVEDYKKAFEAMQNKSGIKGVKLVFDFSTR